MIGKSLLMQWSTLSPIVLMQTLPAVSAVDLHQRAVWAYTIPALLESGQVQSTTGLLYFQNRDWDRAVAHYSQALQTFESAKDTVAVGCTLTQLSVVFAHRRQYRWAVDYAQQAVNSLSQTDSQSACGAALHNLGVAYYHRGRNRLALKVLEKALALRSTLGDDIGEALTLGCMGRVYTALGQYWSALSCYEVALDIYHQYQSVFEGSWYETTIRLRLAKMARKLGHPDLAIAHYQAALTLSHGTLDTAQTADILNELGRVHEDLQQITTALAYYQQAQQLMPDCEPVEGDRERLENIPTSGLFSLYY